MPQLEREPIPQKPDSDAYWAERMGRQNALGEEAINNFLFLPEARTAYEDERAYMKARLIGQDAAIESILTSLDRSGTRPPSDTRPVANLAFLGPTGVGKTEAAKVLSEILNLTSPNLVRIDCSNFSQDHEVSSLVGSPPGYVSRQQEPLLSKGRIEKKGTVLLFDEIEKGCGALYNLLLQVLDNGSLTLNNGTIVSFRDVIIIMTSNLGAKEMAKEASGARTGFSNGVAEALDADKLQSVALKSFKDFFKPEFVNRLDDMIVFPPLSEESLHAVLKVKLDVLNETYVDEHGAYISLSQATSDFLVKHALKEREFGARPLVRAINKNIETNFGRYTSTEIIPEGTEVMVYHRDELPGTLTDRYKGELLFATRPDASVKKRPADKKSKHSPDFISAEGTAIVPYKNPDDEDDSKRDPDDEPDDDPDDLKEA